MCGNLNPDTPIRRGIYRNVTVEIQTGAFVPRGAVMDNAKKYEFTGETRQHLGRTLRRIRSLVSFGDIVAGAVGGWVEDEKNLSHYGNAWVHGNAQVYGDARVSGNARVYGNARVSGNAQVSGNAWVHGNAQVHGNARVSGNAQVSGNAWVHGNAQVSGDAQVTPICVTGLTYPVTVTDNHMMIGCEFHLISEWREFDDRRIAQMDGLPASRFWRDHRTALLAICDANRPNEAKSTQ